MLLVERYVAAVRSHLPRKQRDDIAAELRETLRAQIEVAEAESGRALSEDEIVRLLQRYGAPLVVAARYRGRDHLIGPTVYPHYQAFVKKMLWAFSIVLAVALVVTAFTADDPVSAMARVIGLGVLIAIANLTIVTLIFARLERSGDGTEWTERWDPRDLTRGTAPPTTIPRREMVGAILTTTFWLLWWIDVLPLNEWLLWRHLPLAPAPIWEELTPLVVSLMILNIAASVIALLRPRAVRFYQAASMVLDVGIAVMLYRALNAPAYIVALDDQAGTALAGLFNVLITIGLLAFGVVIAISIVSTLRQWIVMRRVDLAAALI